MTSLTKRAFESGAAELDRDPSGDTALAGSPVAKLTGSAMAVSGTGNLPGAVAGAEPLDGRWQRVQARLRGQFGEDIYTNWFKSLEFVACEAMAVELTVPTRFLKNWIGAHYIEQLRACCQAEYGEINAMNVNVRQPGVGARAIAQLQAPSMDNADHRAAAKPAAGLGGPRVISGGLTPRFPMFGEDRGAVQGSQLERHSTFEQFVVGRANHIAHAAARQIAETALDDAPKFNPLYIHSAVGLGKTHLLQSITSEVRKRHPEAQVTYMTAEKFRHHFVEAIHSKDGLAFKDAIRRIDMLLIDDMEFLHGDKTSQEFDYTLNAMLDARKQVVVASARPPAQLDKLDQRMRSRLGGGLVTEIRILEPELRLAILERRVAERKVTDPGFHVGPDVIAYLAERLVESVRDLDGAATRLYHSYQFTRMPVTMEMAEQIIRELAKGGEPRRIKIDDIVRIVAKHYGVTKLDILSERRHRSIVWPRQIGMYLAKNMTARSLPEIGRRFGGRDHTTVLHAIRKIDGVLKVDDKLKDEIEDLKKIVASQP